MTAQEINIAIAEACGFSPPWTEKLTPCACDGVNYALYDSEGRRLPDYTEDLNAMQSAESTLSETEVDSYVEIYETLWNTKLPIARQRAEAFLRTKGLWRD